MAEPDVVRVAREYREQLARNEDAALKRMSHYWTEMERHLSAEFQALAQDVKDRLSTGTPIPRQYLYTLNRYRSMMEQIQREMPYYQLRVEDLIKDYQKKNYTLGLDDANAVIKAAKPSSDVWTRVYKDAAETMAGFAGNGAPLRDLLQADYGDMSECIMDALVSGVGLGKGYQQVAKDMRDAMGMDFDRSLRIARTEINRSYRLANAEQYRRSGVVEKVLRLCYPPTACFACLEMDGEECPNGICDDHPNGKCTTIVVTTGGVAPDWEKGSDWLMQQSEEDQRRIMGDGRFDLWKNYGVSPRSMVTMKQNPVWGGSPSMISIADIIAQNGITLQPKTVTSIPTPAPVVNAAPGTREAAIQTIKGSNWYKSAINVSNAPDELTNVIDGMTEEQAKVYANGLQNVQSVDLNYTGRAHVSPWDKSVYVDLNNPASKDKVAGYSTSIRTMFHELSHGIDLFNAEDIHTMSGLHDKIEECAINWANGIYEAAGIPKIKSFGRLSPDQKNTIIRELWSDPDQYHSVSDIFEGLTNERICGKYGHGKNYWKWPLQLEKEFVAHSGQAWVTGSRFTEVFGDAVDMVTEEMKRLYDK